MPLLFLNFGFSGGIDLIVLRSECHMRRQQKIAMGLCLFYLISVIGIAVNMHYCSGKLSSVRFTEQAKCGACKGEEKVKDTHNCCKTTEVDVKVKDSHQAGFKVKIPENFSIQLLTGPRITDIFKVFLPNIFRAIENKVPPLSAKLSLHIYNCVFRN